MPLPSPALPGEPAPSLLQRMGRAFSLRASLIELFAAPPAHSRPVDGLRALAILWVILFHVFQLTGVFMDRGEFERLFLAVEADPLRGWVLRGDHGVDLFFVLSGYLITRILMHEQEQTGRVRIPTFYWRRFLRLMPAYAAVLLLYVASRAPNHQNAWANVLYLNNFLPVSEQAVIWSWSLAIEEQFYLVFPFFWLVVGTRRHAVWVMAALLLLGVGIEHALVVRHGFTMPFTIDPLMQGDAGQRYFNSIYDKPYTRYTPILAGVLVAYLLGRTRVAERLRAAPVLAHGILVLALGTLGVLMAPRTFSGEWGPVEGTLYLTLYRTLFGVGAAALLLLIQAKAGGGQVLGRVLAWRALRPIAQLSYAAYLVHPLIIFGLYGSMTFGGAASVSLLQLSAMSLGLTLWVSLVLHVLIERPLMRLRPA
ncbi:acyltransferase [Corallococcus sp. CA047B]|uniref:acyltransferase family protein n=1 Tax=Corallococcus sp. CA047B TaxID=2316729 RepID=UPI000EA2FB67|nr:acyltransferase [Corallococcus sp. CA047B]RKH16919.1 acyltransferase [Corallococcus sp. CA047B]